MANYTITQQAVRVLNGTQTDGVTLTNVGAIPVYIANDSSANTISQVLDIGGSMYFEPYSEIWATVNSTTVQGLITGVFSASDRFNYPAPGVTFVGTFGMTSAGSSINWDFDQGESAGSQYQAYKIVVRFPNNGINPTTAGDYEYVVGANLNLNGQNTQTQASSILIDSTYLVVTNLAPAYVIVPLTTATSGTLFITPPANTAAVGNMVMDVYGLTHAPAQLIAWSDPSLTLSSNWAKKGNTWYYAIATTSATTSVFLPAMGANFSIGITATIATNVGQNIQLQTFTATPATTATKYNWDTALAAFTAAGTLTTQRTYYTTPGLPLVVTIVPNGTAITNIRLWIQNNAQIAA